jgi:TAT (twin-arginine translocation) pathway signal sequence
MDRRTFLQTAAALAATSAIPSVASPVTNKKTDKMIGIQIGAVSFVDEGVNGALDTLQECVNINTLFVTTFTYGRGTAGRQIPGQPFPDHGKREYDTNFYGGCYTKVNSKYYKDTVFQDFRAPDFGDYDVLEAVIPEAKRRGMKIVCWMEDVYRKDRPSITNLQEKQFSGENAVTLCFNNPDYYNWLLDLTEDWARSYDVDGIMWGSERQGAFSDMLGASHTPPKPQTVTCFCDFCIARARKAGVNPERAKQGFSELLKFVTIARQGHRPSDGYYVQLWRLLLRYPELLQWETLWTDSLHDIQAAVYHRVRTSNPKVEVGWHLWHNNSFNPIYRAELDLQELSKYSDFLKVVMYHNCAGEREVNYINSVGTTIYGDVPAQELLDFHYRVMNFREANIEKIPLVGFSADYVYRETVRSREDLTGTKTKLWSGLDVDIPTAKGHSVCTPEGTRDVVLAAFKGGADGVLLSRKYSEMKLDTLRGAGSALKELGMM